MLEASSGEHYTLLLFKATGRKMELEAATSCEGSDSHEFTSELSYRMYGPLDRGEIGMILVHDKSKMEYSRSARWMGNGVCMLMLDQVVPWRLTHLLRRIRSKKVSSPELWSGDDWVSEAEGSHA